MTKHAKGGDKGGNDKGGGKKGGGKGHGQKKQHNVVVNHHRVSEKVHKKEQDPVYFGVGAIREHVVLSENLSKYVFKHQFLFSVFSFAIKFLTHYNNVFLLLQKRKTRGRKVGSANRVRGSPFAPRRSQKIASSNRRY